MQKLKGIPASNGIAIGPVFIYQPELPVVERRSITDPTAEVARLETVIAAAATDLHALKAKTEAVVGAEDAQIFEVHRMFLEDPALTGAIKEAIETSQINAEAAVSQTASALVEQFEALDDEYFRQRAADRTNPLVAPLADPLHPAVLRLIRQVIEAGHAHGKWVGMCGELAGNPLAVPVLLGLGLDEFSMTASAIPPVKALIRRLSLPQAQGIAVECLKLADLAEVEQFLS